MERSNGAQGWEIPDKIGMHMEVQYLLHCSSVPSVLHSSFHLCICYFKMSIVMPSGDKHSSTVSERSRAR